MKQSTPVRRLASLFMMLCLLAAPVAVLAKKGEKNFRRGIDDEKMEQWEQAAQEYALALAANPSDLEYQLHYRRALFNASQKFMSTGRTLAEQGDYTGAYNAFRQAYGYDPVNELAVAEMNRMMRLQREKEGANATKPGALIGGGTAANGATTVPAAFEKSTGAMKADAAQGGRVADGQAAQGSPVTPRSEQLRVINYNGDLEDFIRRTAAELGLNVIVDRDFPKRQVKIELRDVTAARALDHIFIAQNLFFQKLDRRTILVADQSKRGQYQQLVLRTFYLTNIDPQDARNLIQSALPPNAGRQPLVTPNKATNSITVRDTPENIRLIEDLLRAIDKDRAEVVIDVNIYEVSHSNLLQLGNQIGSASSLGNLGGFNPLTILVGGPNGRGEQTATTKGGTTKSILDTAATAAVTALGGTFVLPPTQLAAFQAKDNSRLMAHTQVHAFDGEQSITRIGEKVPIQTAQVTPFGGVSGTGGNNGGINNGGVNNGVFGGNGYPVIQYQDTGLNLKFTPQVFPNQDVEVKMEIESNDVIGLSSSLTPTFSQRTMSGKARIPNGRTVMIASVAQNKESRGRQGLPLLGLIPVLGRLFSTPTHNDANADIVITVSPIVLSAPVVTPEDIEVRGSGTLQAPISDSLEAMVRAADREDSLAAARQLPTSTTVEVPTAAAAEAASKTNDASAAPSAQPAQTVAQSQPNAPADAPTYAPAPKILAGVGGASVAGNSFVPSVLDANARLVSNTNRLPVVNTEDAPPPVREVVAPAKVTPPGAAPLASLVNAPANGADGAGLFIMAGQKEMRVGEKQRLMIFVKTDTPLALAAATLKFDPRLFSVRSVAQGSLFTDAVNAPPSITQSVDPRGSLLALVAPRVGAPVSGAGVLLFVEIEALAAGEGEISFDPSGVHLMSAGGASVAVQTSPVRLTVKQQ
ncbi:MAG: secretin N-terminal domain-containing protein [Pyrinomonadaceae bacterium]